MAIYKGLNVSLYLGDVDNLTNSLSNLGLELADLDRIRGLGTNITTAELHLLSGLDLDQEKETYSLYRSANVLNNELLSIQDISRPLDFNIRVNDQLRAGAIKYNFLEYNPANTTPGTLQENYVTSKSADISTSRVSSWSKIGNGPIFYGANLNLNPVDPDTGQHADTQKTVLRLDNGGTGSTADATLIIGSEITPKRFEAEETTDLVSLNVNGTTREFYAMRSIPTEFYGFFRDATLVYETEPGISTATPTFVFADLSTDPVVEIPISGSNSGDTINFSVTRATDRRIDIYYRPDGIRLLQLQNIKMLEFPNTVLKNLESIDIAFNDLSDTPDWYTIAGGGIAGHTVKLRDVTMTDNGLDRSPDSANTQLHRLPSSVQNLYINGCYRDSETIDIGQLPDKDGNNSGNAPSELRTLQFDAYYSSYNARQMSDTGVSPEINENEIRTYYVRRQPYRTLAYSVQQSPTLQTLNMHNCNLSNAAVSRGTTAGAVGAITLASNVISYIDLSYNSVDVVNVSGKTSLSTYYHYRNWSGGGTNIDGFFTGCQSLSNLQLYNTYVTGDVGSAFTNLPNLKTLHVYNTRLSGRMTPASMQGNSSLEYINLSHGNFNTTTNNANNFFGNSVVDQLNPAPDAIGAQYGGGYYAGKMENSTSNTPYSDGFSRPAGEEYYLVVADKSAEFVGTLTESNSHATNLSSGGFTDWDLPTAEELELMYRNLKPTNASNDTGEPDLQPNGGNPYSVPAYNRRYTNNSPGQTPVVVFKSNGTQAFELADTQNYIAGTSGWNVYNDAQSAVDDDGNDTGFAPVDGTRVEVIQGTQDGGIWKGPFTLPKGAYDVQLRMRHIDGNAGGLNDNITVHLSTTPGGNPPTSEYELLMANQIDNDVDITVLYTLKAIDAGTYYIHVSSPEMDFSIDEFYFKHVGSIYRGDTFDTHVNVINGDADSIRGGNNAYATQDQYLRVRPIRRVPVRTGIQIEQEETSTTFANTPNLKYFYLRYTRGIKGKFPNVGYLNNIRNFYAHNLGLEGPIPDFSFANSLYNLYIFNNYHTGTFSLSNSNVRRVRIYNNDLDALGTVECPRMWEFHASNNNLTGSMPSYENSGYLHDLYLHNNDLDNYISGSLSSNKYLRKVFLYNNDFTLNDCFRMLVDLQESYNARPRSNCQVNLTGNSLITESELVTYPEFFGILEFLRSKGWTILLNP